MEKDIRLIAIDMDGTLLNNKKEIPKEEKEALQYAEKLGIKVVLCTGRPYFGALPLYEKLELEKEKGYLILNNGCSVYETANFELMDYFEVTGDEMQYLYEISGKFDVDLTLTTEKHFYFVGEEGEEPNEKTVFDSTQVYTPLTRIDIREALKCRETVFKAMFTGYPENVDKLEEYLTDEMRKKFNFVRSQAYILEALPLGANKGEGIKRLIRKLGIDRNQVMGIGDAENDIEMLEYVGHSVAMGNSSEKIKRISRYVTDTNENSGVSKIIYKLVK